MVLEQYIVQYAAPTLAGLKAGSLFSYPTGGDRNGAYRMIYSQNLSLFSQGVKVEVLGESRDRLLVYVYRVSRVEELLADPRIRAFLAEQGYTPGAPVGATLKRLRQRIAGQADFPHEIGVFLDYPLADVEAFIESGGKNYAYLGYWKAYSQPDRARAVCEQYRACTDRLMDWLGRGSSLVELVQTGTAAG